MREAEACGDNIAQKQWQMVRTSTVPDGSHIIPVPGAPPGSPLPGRWRETMRCGGPTAGEENIRGVGDEAVTASEPFKSRQGELFAKLNLIRA